MSVGTRVIGRVLAGLMLLSGVCAPANAGQVGVGDNSPPSPAVAPPAAADWISTDGQLLLDAARRQVLLRGFVTITHNSDGTLVDYTEGDYRRMRLMGADNQSIRIFLGILEGRRGEAPREAYLKKLENMVQLAKKVGIRSEFKMTVYDIKPFGREQWKTFWENQGGQQEDLIRAWRHVWSRFKDEPFVVGYDLLNEAQMGGLAVPEDEFVAKYLAPLYRRMIDALRESDSRHLAFFQPLLGGLDLRTGTVLYPPFTVSVDRQGTVYAPHFYTSLLGLDTGAYAARMERCRKGASLNHSPLFIGEYGVPWNRQNDGQAAEESRQRVPEQAAADLFDAERVGFSRPWYADDRARAGKRLNWAIIKGTDGLGGEDRKFITDVFARPYPQCTAGRLLEFRHDHAARKFTMRYAPDSAKDRTEIFVPVSRHFVEGFTLHYGSGVTLTWTPAAGIKVIENSAGAPPGTFAWNTDSHCLTIGEWLKDQKITIEIQP